MKITLQHVIKKYGDIIAVNDITATFDSGEMVCILGPSGSGKTTLLYLVAGLLTADSGDIFFDEHNVTRMSPEKRNIGVVFQDFGLFPYQTVLETICFPIEMQQLSKANRLLKAQEIAQLLKIEELLKRKTNTLSAGQKQRVAIARALAKSPKILLMDESLNHLDEALRIELRTEIRKLQKDLGITMLFVTHSEEEALCIADKIIVLNEGKMKHYSNVEKSICKLT